MKKTREFTVRQADCVKSLDSAPRTASAAGASADLKGFQSAFVVFDVDARTNGSQTLKLQESTDNSTWTDVAAADLVFESGSNGVDANGQLVVDGAADDDQAVVIHYAGSARWIRAHASDTGGAAGVDSGAIIFRGDKARQGKNNS